MGNALSEIPCEVRLQEHPQRFTNRPLLLVIPLGLLKVKHHVLHHLHHTVPLMVVERVHAKVVRAPQLAMSQLREELALASNSKLPRVLHVLSSRLITQTSFPSIALCALILFLGTLPFFAFSAFFPVLLFLIVISSPPVTLILTVVVLLLLPIHKRRSAHAHTNLYAFLGLRIENL